MVLNLHFSITWNTLKNPHVQSWKECDTTGYREKVKEHCALAGKRSEQLFEWGVVGRRGSVGSLWRNVAMTWTKEAPAKPYTLDFLFKRLQVHSSYLPLLAPKTQPCSRNRINADTHEDREERKQLLTKTAVSELGSTRRWGDYLGER